MNATDQPGDALQVLSSGLVPLVGDVAAVFVVAPDQEQSERFRRTSRHDGVRRSARPWAPRR